MKDPVPVKQDFFLLGASLLLFCSHCLSPIDLGCRVYAEGSVRQEQAPLRIDVWYGQRQRFGYSGNPQRWINVLGRLAGHSDSASLEYTLNASQPKPLAIGPNHTRLASRGDFNVEIDRSDLKIGENTVAIFAKDGSEEANAEVVIEYAGPMPSPLPLQIDWSKANRIQDMAQIVDGRWEITDGGVRVLEPYYDRVLAIGDENWTDYEVTAEVTFHGYRRPGPADGGNKVVHAAIAVHWPGHSDSNPPDQPRSKWYPLGAVSEFMIQNHPDGCRWRIFGDRYKQVVEEKPRRIEFEKKYVMKHRVESIGESVTAYRVKLWDAGEPEPAKWDLSALEEMDVSSGGALLVAHYADVTFGNVRVTSCKEQPDQTNSPKVSAKDEGPSRRSRPGSEVAPGPRPGNVCCEYAVNIGDVMDSRVTDWRARDEGTQPFLTNPVLHLCVSDLEHAVRAETTLHRRGSHAGAKDKRFRFNGNSWKTPQELKQGHPRKASL